MARGKKAASWEMVGSIVRAISISMTGQELPLGAFIPNDYLPDGLKKIEPTAEEKAEMEETKRKLAELDKQILSKAMREGRFRGRLNGTRK